MTLYEAVTQRLVQPGDHITTTLSGPGKFIGEALAYRTNYLIKRDDGTGGGGPKGEWLTSGDAVVTFDAPEIGDVLVGKDISFKVVDVGKINCVQIMSDVLKEPIWRAVDDVVKLGLRNVGEETEMTLAQIESALGHKVKIIK